MGDQDNEAEILTFDRDGIAVRLLGIRAVGGRGSRCRTRRRGNTEHPRGAEDHAAEHDATEHARRNRNTGNNNYDSWRDDEQPKCQHNARRKPELSGEYPEHDAEHADRIAE